MRLTIHVRRLERRMLPASVDTAKQDARLSADIWKAYGEGGPAGEPCTLVDILREVDKVYDERTKQAGKN